MDINRLHVKFRRERAVLVGLETQELDAQRVTLDELGRLAESAGAEVVGELEQRRPRPDPGYYVGRGKAEEISELAEELEADVLLFDNDLSPGQIRKLEELSKRRVIDRSELIMDIFASRARTRQAKLQVELAQLEYALPRLRRMWTHLSRIEGGIGTRGPGEKQLETDRRIIQERISELKARLKEIGERRRRQVESRGTTFTLSLVGYTNVGKSSLLNRLTTGGAVVADRLFMTLDTKTRLWDLGSPLRVLVSDTVGFIRKLPHHLISSFHATLEEARDADLLLHVIDASHPDALDQVESVNRVLDQIGAGDRPTIRVLNKVDRLEDREVLAEIASRFSETVAVSAKSGVGIDELTDRVREQVLSGYEEAHFDVEPANGRLRSFLHERGVLLESSTRENGEWNVRVLLNPADLGAARRL